MSKRRLIEEIANNTYYCKLENFKDIAYHELRHMGLDPKEYQEEINLFIDKKIYEQRAIPD